MVHSSSESESGDHTYRYLEGAIQTALSEIGVAGARIKFISDTGNLIFRADGQAQSFAIRVYKDSHVSNSSINAELFWLLDIKRKNQSFGARTTIRPIIKDDTGDHIFHN